MGEQEQAEGLAKEDEGKVRQLKGCGGRPWHQAGVQHPIATLCRGHICKAGSSWKQHPEHQACYPRPPFFPSFPLSVWGKGGYPPHPSHGLRVPEWDILLHHHVPLIKEVKVKVFRTQKQKQRQLPGAPPKPLPRDTHTPPPPKGGQAPPAATAKPISSEDSLTKGDSSKPLGLRLRRRSRGRAAPCAPPPPSHPEHFGGHRPRGGCWEL